MPRNTAQLFAILRDSEVRRLPLRQPLQPRIYDLFQEQADRLVSDEVEALDFDPNLRPDDDHVIRIPNFVASTAMVGALLNPLAIEPLEITTESLEQIVGLFTGEPAPNLVIWLQAFSRKQVLARTAISLVLAGDTLTQMTEPGLVLDSQLAAVVEDDNLYFRNFNSAKRILNLADYYREATDVEVVAFAGHARIHCDDLGVLQAVSDTWIRRRVALLVEDGSLDGLRPRTAAKVAERFDVTLSIRRVGGQDKIELPTNKAELKKVLRFLGEDYYEAPLSGTKYESHSKRRLNVDVS